MHSKALLKMYLSVLTHTFISALAAIWPVRLGIYSKKEQTDHLDLA